MTPPPPFSSSLRLANIEDLPRIGIVAVGGFYHSPDFEFERPRHDDFPHDTLANYRAFYRHAILDPGALVLVSEDDYDEQESEAVHRALRDIYPAPADQRPAHKLGKGRVIVGVASLVLEADVKRHAEFLPDGPVPDIHLESPDDRERDKSGEAGEQFEKYLTAPEERWFNDRLEITTMVVHPAYFRRGHGSTLTRWCTDLADLDHIGIGVSAQPRGQKLFSRLGFVEKEMVEVKGYKEHPESISMWLGVRDRDASKGAKSQ